MSGAAQVTLTRLAVVGATCEACSRSAVISARSSNATRYYCPAHVLYALRPLLLGVGRA